jgi:hypothetical protein
MSLMFILPRAAYLNWIPNMFFIPPFLVNNENNVSEFCLGGVQPRCEIMKGNSVINYEYYWSALATSPASSSARTGPLISLKLVFVCLSNHKSTTSDQPRKLKFGILCDFNPTKRTVKEANWGTFTQG